MNLSLIKAETNLILKRFEGAPSGRLFRRKNPLALKTNTTK